MLNLQAIQKLSKSLQEKILTKPLMTIVRSANPDAQQEYEDLPTINKIGKNFQIPDKFDGREVWKGLLTPVRQQGKCGSCWAFASTSTLADRFNIQSVGQMHVILSPTKVLLCDFKGDEFKVEHPETDPDDITRIASFILTRSGCYGNTLVDAWRYLYIIGTNTETCFPYNKLFGNYGQTDLSKFDKEGQIPLCTNLSGPIGDMCANVSYHSVTGEEYGDPARFYRCVHYYGIAGTTKNGGDELFIRHNIFGWGPVSTGMTIYPDFYTFDSVHDIYEWNGNGEPVGGHAVEIVGWGEENNKKYWIIKNSWGINWGRSGYFCMVRGINNCEIEENVVAGIPDFFYPENFKLDNPGNFIWGETMEIRRERQAIDTKLTMSGGGIDPNTGYTRRIMAVKPWMDFDRPVKLKNLPNWNTFIAGIDASPQNRIKFNKTPQNTYSDLSYYISSGIILFLLIVGVYIILRRIKMK